jgi:hypothetical protein
MQDDNTGEVSVSSSAGGGDDSRVMEDTHDWSKSRRGGRTDLLDDIADRRLEER